MAHGLGYQQLHSYEDNSKWLDSWIDLKDEHFYVDGISSLPQTWENVVTSDGQYF